MRDDGWRLLGNCVVSVDGKKLLGRRWFNVDNWSTRVEVFVADDPEIIATVTSAVHLERGHLARWADDGGRAS